MRPSQRWPRHVNPCRALSRREAPCAGANLEVDVPWKYLNFFLDDDEKLERIGREYGAGRMLTGEIKAELVQVRTKRPCLPPRFPLE